MPKVSLNCKNCGEAFLVYPSRVKEGAKYCGNKCAHSGVHNPFYGKTHGNGIPKNTSTLRTWLMKRRGAKCERCSYDKLPIMHLHHIDRDRKNTTPENCALLCPNCHDEDHYANKDGRWHGLSRTTA